MAELKGTKTEANLMAAFAGESQARNKYTYYASKAKKDGYVQIANIFEETAANEKEHAKIFSHNRTAHDLQVKIQIPYHTADHRQLLGVFLSKIRPVR